MKTLNEVLKDWEAVIGLEVHTELTTLETKMFCGCRLSHDDEPNTNVCPVCLGMPGALPVPNEEAIRSIVKAGLATNCTIEKRSMFYRKHYFYPDMAKNFQTTQGPVAFCMHGHLDLEVQGPGAKEREDRSGLEALGDGYVAPVRILRIHMEEDAAKMVHVGGEEGRIASATESLIDYNRCGTPLIELVTEPDLRTPEEARLFMEKLRRTFLALGISDCSMESGSMRCDGNVSLRRRGSKGLGTKTELKNINSFKSLHDGLEYEIRRQAEVLESGGEVFQETRHWEPSKKRTVVMRVKETADDYRLFPDPDLAPFDLSDEFVEGCRRELPELPDARRDRYVAEYGLKRADAAQLAADPDAAAFFDAAVGGAPKLAQGIANLLVNDVAGHLNAAGLGFSAPDVAPAQVAGLAALLAEDAITAKQGREVVELMAGTGQTPEAIVDARGMRQVTDDGALLPIVEAVVADCPDQVAQFKDGNQRVVGFLVGQCMRRAKGSGNPKRFNELLVETMSEAPAAKAEPAAAEKGAAAAAKPEAAKPAAAKTAKPIAEKAEAEPAKKAPAAKTSSSAAKPAEAAEKKPASKAAAAKKAATVDADTEKAAAKPAAKRAEAKPVVAAKPAEAAEKAAKTAEPAEPAEKKGAATKPAEATGAKKAEADAAEKAPAAKPVAKKAPAAKKAPSKPAAAAGPAVKKAEAEPAAKKGAKPAEKARAAKAAEPAKAPARKAGSETAAKPAVKAATPRKVEAAPAKAPAAEAAAKTEPTAAAAKPAPKKAAAAKGTTAATKAATAAKPSSAAKAAPSEATEAKPEQTATAPKSKPAAKTVSAPKAPAASKPASRAKAAAKPASKAPAKKATAPKAAQAPKPVGDEAPAAATAKKAAEPKAEPSKPDGKPAAEKAPAGKALAKKSAAPKAPAAAAETKPAEPEAKPAKSPANRKSAVKPSARKRRK